MTGFGDMLDERLLRERIIWLEGEVRDENSNRIAKQLQVLAAEDPDKDITLYINSPGGSITAGMVIYDTMQLIPNDITTIAMGLAASMGQFLLCAGAAGKRYATPNTRIMMHQPLGGIGGTASDIKIQAEQMLFIKKRMAQLIADHSGQTLEQIESDSDRDRWFTPEDAKVYGLIDHVYSSAADAPPVKTRKVKGETP
jgi:ATP-dependent Clp protease protease subunit